MSSSTSSGKAFTFKKRVEVPVVELVEVPSEEDDDDFKPSKHHRRQLVSSAKGADASITKGKNGSAKLEEKVVSKTDKKTKPMPKVKNSTLSKSSNGAGASSNNDNVALLQELQNDTESNDSSEALALVDLHLVAPRLGNKTDEKEFETDDVEFVGTISSGSSSKFSGSLLDKDGGKEAWKKLMSKMQTSQTSSQISKKGKGKGSVAKRGFTKNSNAVTSSGGKRTPTQSPLKKSPRLEDAEVRSLRTLDESQPGIGSVSKVCFPSTSQSQADVKTKTSSLSLDSTVESVKENSIKVAPIFLPPSERKALQKTTSLKSDSNEILQSIINSTSQGQYEEEPENPSHFSGNKVILNEYLSDKDPYEGNKTKVCPFYKKLPGVPFCVDAFNYGLIPGMEVYFLSHFHSDHYIGLTKKFCKTIICSHPTGNLVRMKLYVEEKCIRKLHLDKPYLINDSEVTLIDANHCPGSVMFLFRFKNGSVTLHVGDFRYTPDMLQNPFLAGVSVDNLYLDTTYCSPQYDFPTQNESIANVISHVKRHLEFRPDTLILCGSYLIGKERVYFTLAEAIGSKVFGPYDKRKILNALGNKKFSSLLCADEDAAQVHVVPMFSITAKNLQEYLAKHPKYTNIIGIKPSGWQFSSCASGCSVKTHYNGSVTLLGVPYSEHSSYSELKEFVSSLKPRKVQPTVNVGNPKKRGEMMQYIETWLSS